MGCGPWTEDAAEIQLDKARAAYHLPMLSVARILGHHDELGGVDTKQTHETLLAIRARRDTGHSGEMELGAHCDINGRRTGARHAAAWYWRFRQPGCDDAYGGEDIFPALLPFGLLFFCLKHFSDTFVLLFGHAASTINADSGKVLWQKDFKAEYGVKTPVWGFAAHPLVRGEHLICLARGDGSTVVCYDKLSGKEVWRSLSAKEPGYCPPTLIHAGGVEQLIIWHPESLNSLNPDTGEIYWSEPFRVRSGLSIPTPRQLGNRLFITAFYNGSMMMNLDPDKPGATLAWKSKRASEKNTEELHSIMPTPFFEDNHIYGVCSYGQLRCLRADTGERVWEDLTATRGGVEARWANAFLVKHENRFFLFNELGNLLIARLSPKGYEELDKAHLIEPTGRAAGRDVVWSHPAFANRNVLVRNDKEIASFSLAK